MKIAEIKSSGREKGDKKKKFFLVLSILLHELLKMFMYFQKIKLCVCNSCVCVCVRVCPAFCITSVLFFWHMD